jgi:hypothetical protein
MTEREVWDVDPFRLAGPLGPESTLTDVVSALGEEPRRIPGSRLTRCQFREQAMLVFVDDEDGVHEVEFMRRSRIVPAYRGIRLLGNWKSARERLLALGLVSPEPDRNEEQGFSIVRGLSAWIPFERAAPETIAVTLRPDPNVPRETT